MVKIINKSVCRGAAGRRNGNVKGVVIHNDAGSIHATAEAYVQSLGVMTNAQLANGFAHYYIDRNTIARVEDTYNMAWHTANSDGNANYIGYEVCQSYGASNKDFLANEQMAFKQAAEDLKYYGLPVNRNTVRLHKEFSPTACPHRSWDLHGKSVNAVKDYFIKEIKKYYNNPELKPGGAKPVKKTVNNRPKHKLVTGTYATTSTNLKNLRAYLKKENLKYTEKKEKNGRITVIVSPFNQNSGNKYRLEQWLGDRNLNYHVSFA